MKKYLLLVLLCIVVNTSCNRLGIQSNLFITDREGYTRILCNGPATLSYEIGGLSLTDKLDKVSVTCSHPKVKATARIISNNKFEIDLMADKITDQNNPELELTIITKKGLSLLEDETLYIKWYHVSDVTALTKSNDTFWNGSGTSSPYTTEEFFVDASPNGLTNDEVHFASFNAAGSSFANVYGKLDTMTGKLVLEEAATWTGYKLNGSGDLFLDWSTGYQRNYLQLKYTISNQGGVINNGVMRIK